MDPSLLGDPWFWTVDQVIQALCSESGVWAENSEKPVLPNLIHLAHALRDCSVDGPNLLVSVDDEALRQDLGVTVFGERGTIKRAIAMLRSRSKRYEEISGSFVAHLSGPRFKLRDVASTAPTLLNDDSDRSERGSRPETDLWSGSLSHAEEGPFSLRQPQDTAFGGTDTIESRRGSGSTDNASALSPSSSRRIGRKAYEWSDKLDARPQTGWSDSSGSAAVEKSSYEDTLEGAIRSRLGKTEELSTIEAAIRKKLHQPKMADKSQANRRRVGVVPVTLKEDTMDIDEAPATLHLRNWEYVNKANEDHLYLDSEAMPVDQIFYGAVNIGGQLSNDVEHGSMVGATVTDQNNFSLVVVGPAYPGLQRFVHRAIKRALMRSEPKVIQKGEMQVHAVQPYLRRVAQNGLLSITLFPFDPYMEKVSAVRGYLRGDSNDDELASDTQLPDDDPADTKLGDLPTDVSGQDYGAEDFDYLYKWRHQVDDRLLPAFGDSGSEASFDSETWEEMQAEMKNEKSEVDNDGLSRDDVLAVIDACIAKFVEKWESEKLSGRERKAWSLWRKAKREGTKKIQVRRARDLVNKIDNERLPKLIEEIAGQSWTHAAQIQRQCGVLEQSVFDREDQKWLISTLNSVDEPDRPQPLPQKKPERRRSHVNPDEREVPDEEILESEADDDEASGDEDWIVDDDELAVSQHDDSDGNATVRRSGRKQQAKAPNRKPRNSSPYHRADRALQANDMPSPMLVREEPDFMPLIEDEDDVGTRNQQQPKHREVIDLTIASDDIDDEDRADNNAASALRSKSKKPAASTPVPLFQSPAVINLVSSSTEGRRVSENEHQDSDGEPLGDYTDERRICARSVDYYIKRRDRKRLLVKILGGIPIEIRRSLASRIFSVRESDFRGEILSFLKDLQVTERLRGFNDATSNVIARFGYLYSSFSACRHFPYADGIPIEIIPYIFNHENRWTPFYELLKLVLPKPPQAPPKPTQLPLSKRPSTGSSALTPHKKRKREVAADVEAEKRREGDRRRTEATKQRQRQLERKYFAMGRTLNGDPSSILVNVGKADEDAPVYLNHRIGLKIKGHQIEGIRFMWREIVADSKAQGCLLAHEMGLGKTMQVLSLLVTVAEAAKSDKPEVSVQIPPRLKVCRGLILCPPTLVDNWADEFNIWVPLDTDTVGRLYILDSRILETTNRLQLIATWFEKGGVLIASYAIFRDLVLNKASRLNSTQHLQVKKHLLEGPSIVVADEAHQLKNPQSATAQAASKIVSQSRIALTGSPLANNLEEYHSLIGWVAPGYLGPLVEFRAHYIEPIQEGLYQDSSEAEIRKSLTMLAVLKADLEPKVSRADVSVLKSDLTSKTEFVIGVPLTSLQQGAYNTYVRSTASGAGSSAGLFDHLSMLVLLCNHPQIFLAKLQERESKAQEAEAPDPVTGERSVTPTLDTAHDLGEVSVPKLGLSEQHIGEQLSLLQAVAELDSPDHSYKMLLLELILDAAAAAGDKTLVFSHSIPTLAYVERRFKLRRRKYSRLDGSTTMSKRQDMAKSFNKDKRDVYLISTRAGGLGLNLPAANRVVILDFGFNPAWEKQAIGRAYRLGQRKPVFVYRFTAMGTYEDTILNRTHFKTQLAFRVVEKRNAARSAQKDMTEYFFQYKHPAQKDLSQFKGKDPLVLDKILASQACEGTIRHIQVIDTMATEEAELTAEERRHADQLLRDEKLKRSNPQAWEELQSQRQRDALQVRPAYADEPDLRRTGIAPVLPGSVDAAAALGQTAGSFSMNSPNAVGPGQGQTVPEPIPGAGTRSGNFSPADSVSSRRSSVVRQSVSLGCDATVEAKVHSPVAAQQFSATLEKGLDGHRVGSLPEGPGNGKLGNDAAATTSIAPKDVGGSSGGSPVPQKRGSETDDGQGPSPKISRTLPQHGSTGTFTSQASNPGPSTPPAGQQGYGK